MKTAHCLPPGQYLARGFPILHAGTVPDFDPETWSFKVFGEVEKPLVLDWPAFSALPSMEVTCDIHCVTRWSLLETRWEGVPVRQLLEQAAPDSEARFVMVHGDGGYTTNLPREYLEAGDALLARQYSGRPLTPAHGRPVRLLVPRLYLWKSAKWVRGLELMAEDRPGFWESRGYHMLGDPWREQRYG